MTAGTARTTSASRRRELAGQLSGPLRRFLHTESSSATLLLAATLLALAWANSPWSGAYADLWHATATVDVAGHGLSMSMAHWVNDGLMALFFFAIGLEVRHEFSVGELTNPRRAAIPMIAAVGGLALPALLYLLFTRGGDAAHGWGVVIGTDTAFMLGALAVVGPAFATQLRVFLLTLTVIDDIVAVSVIGIFYSDAVRVGPLAAAAALVAAMGLLSRLGVWRTAPYVVVGFALWYATVRSGLHASIAGMIGGLMVAAHRPRRDVVEGVAQRFRAFRQSPGVELGHRARVSLTRAVSVNERMQNTLHPWTSFAVVPLFALANAGVDLRGGALGDALGSGLTWAVVAALVAGKTLGVGGAAWLGTRVGAGRLPTGVGMGHVLGGAALSGIGFTVALLIAGLAFEDPVTHTRAVVGVLLGAVVATALGWVVFRVAALRGETDADLPRVLERAVDPARDRIRGPVDAPLTLVEFSDFECPFCGTSTRVVDELRARFGDRLRYVMRHLPLVDVHSHTELAAYAAEAAGRQGRFWEMHDVLFAHQDELGYEDLAGYAGELGLDVEEFLRDLDDEEIQRRVREDVADAEGGGARGTPTFFVGDRRHTGPHDAVTLARALDELARRLPRDGAPDPA